MAPVASTACAGRMTLLTRDRSAKTALSGTRTALMPAAARRSAWARPEKEGAVSATMAVKRRVWWAALRKASIVSERPSVRMISLKGHKIRAYGQNEEDNALVVNMVLRVL